MAYNILDPTLQEVILFNYEQFGKLFFMLIIFAVSMVYKFYWKENMQKLTPYYSVGVMRYLLNILSSVVLIASPFFIILLHPAYTLGEFGVLITYLFGTGVTIFGFIFGLDITRLGLFSVAKKCGMDIKDPTVIEFIRRMESFRIYK